ncbi:SufE family protein [Pseudomonas sp. 5P_3.1_Bac2]|uniref:SufE family protein n=1 Tax=Pseudomonas sp. 5P_3.1_Bac2 TaxID=2971617 RepID=UPI0021C68CA7|nr:SufE family protein [Pseudomonas sp. 5P_3.1_Bac2]MCU1715806.1 SufE family protein [Pseudomonas sp. 5P_3.1_Bac2]
MSLPASAQQALQAFSQPASWEQRARLLMQWGERLTPFTDSERAASHPVHGCASAVWLLAERSEQGWQLRADSEARLLRGLLALLLARIEELSAAQIAAVDLTQWFTDLGLGRQLSPSRSNGLNAVLLRVQELLQQP